MKTKGETSAISTSDRLLESYDYQLSPSQIAQRPLDRRAQSKLLVYNLAKDEYHITQFKDIAHYLPSDSTLVFNQSKVYKARVITQKKSGGKVEVFILKPEKNHDGLIPCLLKSSSKKKLGEMLYLVSDKLQENQNRSENHLIIHSQDTIDSRVFYVKTNLEAQDLIEKYGKTPIPPYIRKGESDQLDDERYQTLFAKHTGSVAAPTAGLHFSEDLLKKLSIKHSLAYLCLHVGIGTFSPVAAEQIDQHKMHSEEYFFEKEDVSKIIKASKLIAVGTTSLRSLESRVHGDHFDIKANKLYSTDIFLYPGQPVKSIYGLITNFHLPKSSLIMLVSSLIGRKKTLELYNIALKNNFRFFSYGDAMLILRGL